MQKCDGQRHQIWSALLHNALFLSGNKCSFKVDLSIVTYMYQLHSQF